MKKSNIQVIDLLNAGIIKPGFKVFCGNHFGVVTSEGFIEFHYKNKKYCASGPTLFAKTLGDKSKRGWDACTDEFGQKLRKYRNEFICIMSGENIKPKPKKRKRVQTPKQPRQRLRITIHQKEGKNVTTFEKDVYKMLSKVPCNEDEKSEGSLLPEFTRSETMKDIIEQGNNIKKHVDNLMETISKQDFKQIVSSSRDLLCNEVYLNNEIGDNEIKMTSFFPEKVFSMDPGQVQFRIAEGKFLRLVENSYLYRVTEVIKVCSPRLLKRFEQKRLQLAKANCMKLEDIKPVLTFHGCEDYEIENICSNGCKDSPNGIICSENPEYAKHFIKRNSRVLFCLVLLGNCKCVPQIETAEKQRDYDSVQSSFDETEFKIWDSAQLLPFYIVKYTTLNAETVCPVQPEFSYGDLYV